MKNKQFVVGHPSELNSLSTWPLLRHRGIGKIRLDSKCEHVDKENWEKLLNRDYYACGCETGAKALIVGLIACGAFATYGYIANGYSLGKALFIGLGGSAIVAAAGKIYGLARANVRLKKTIFTIQSSWKVDLPPVKKLISCG